MGALPLSTIIRLSLGWRREKNGPGIVALVESHDNPPKEGSVTFTDRPPGKGPIPPVGRGPMWVNHRERGELVCRRRGTTMHPRNKVSRTRAQTHPARTTPQSPLGQGRPTLTRLDQGTKMGKEGLVDPAKAIVVVSLGSVLVGAVVALVFVPVIFTQSAHLHAAIMADMTAFRVLSPNIPLPPCIGEEGDLCRV